MSLKHRVDNYIFYKHSECNLLDNTSQCVRVSHNHGYYHFQMFTIKFSGLNQTKLPCTQHQFHFEPWFNGKLTLILSPDYKLHSHLYFTEKLMIMTQKVFYKYQITLIEWLNCPQIYYNLLKSRFQLVSSVLVRSNLPCKLRIVDKTIVASKIVSSTLRSNLWAIWSYNSSVKIPCGHLWFCGLLSHASVSCTNSPHVSVFLCVHSVMACELGCYWVERRAKRQSRASHTVFVNLILWYSMQGNSETREVSWRVIVFCTELNQRTNNHIRYHKKYTYIEVGHLIRTIV